MDSVVEPAAPPVSPRENAKPEEENKQDPIEVPYGKEEPNLGATSPVSTRRTKSPLNRISSAGSARLSSHLNTIRSRSRIQSQNYIQEDVIRVHHQRRSSSPLSYKSYKSTSRNTPVPWTFHSTSRMKHLPLPHHPHSTVPFPRVGSARGLRSVPMCTDRYLVNDSSSKSHLRSKSSDSIKSPRSFTDQVKRFDDERKQLYSTRTLKKITEIYSHRLDQGYFMAGSGVGLNSKYDVDEEELDRLREFSRAKLAHRTGSASSQRLRNRERLSSAKNGFFVTQSNMPFDALSGMVISGQQINSTAPSEAGKTINTRVSSAASERNHGIDGINDDDQNATGDAKNDGKTTEAGDDENKDDSKGANGRGDSATDTKDLNDNTGAKTNEEETDGDGTNNANQTGCDNTTCNHSNDSNHGNENSIHGDGSGDGIGNTQADETGSAKHDGNDSHPENGGGGANGMDVDDALSHHGGDGDGIHGNYDADGVHDNGDGRKSGASGDGEDGKTGENSEDGTLADGQSEANKEDDILQISLTSGITLISNPSKLRNKNEVFMTKFDDISDLRNTMEDIQHNNSLNNNDDDNEKDGLDGQNNDENNTNENKEGLDEKRYQLNTRDSEISRMEEKLDKVKLLESGVGNVGHLTESRDDLMELKVAEEDAEKMSSAGYDTGVFAQTKNDEELKEADEKRAAKQEKYRSPYKPTVQEGYTTQTKVKKPYKFHLSDIYKFVTPRQKAIFEHKFDELDTNGNGKVTLKELTTQMKKVKAPKEEIKKFMQVFDLNKNKTIEKKEFVTVAALNDKLTGHETQSEDAPLKLDLDALAFNITAYKEADDLVTFEEEEQDDGIDSPS